MAIFDYPEHLLKQHRLTPPGKSFLLQRTSELAREGPSPASRTHWPHLKSSDLKSQPGFLEQVSN